MRTLVLTLALVVVGCDAKWNSLSSSNPYSTEPQQTLLEARAGFTTKIVTPGESYGPADFPTGGEFELIHYQSAVGGLAAYVTPDPGDGGKHPAVV